MWYIVVLRLEIFYTPFASNSYSSGSGTSSLAAFLLSSFLTILLDIVFSVYLTSTTPPSNC